MIELETAVFLQNQKTGSTFVEKFLQAHCDEALVAHMKHKAPVIRRRGKFHFMTVRDPLDLYLSLFNFGLDGKGQIRERMKKFGMDKPYERGIDGFEDWLLAIFSDEFRPVFKMFAPYFDEMGFCTWRYLRLATFEFRFGEAAVHSTLRFERLNAELRRLAQGPLAPTLRDVDEACAWIDARGRINASTRRDRNAGMTLARDTVAQLLWRDRYLYRRFYQGRWLKLGYRLMRAQDRVYVGDLVS